MSSRMIGFRLDPDNPREAEALHVLAAWQERGYSVRHILTEALIGLDGARESPDSQLAEVLAALREMSRQLEALQAGGVSVQGGAEEGQAELSDAFLLAVKGAVRPGVWLEG